MLFYFNEEEQQWIPLRTQVDMDANCLVGYSDHFSTFDIDVNNWQMANVPTMDSFQQSGFTGAATYNNSLWVPPGPGGLQPSLSVSYNSQVVDGSTARSQASWVGMGWSLDAGGYIERNINGSNTFMEDDTFSIVANGVSSMLLPYDDSSAPSDVIAFRTADENFWKVWAYFSTTSGFERIERWEVWDKMGTNYTFGDQPLAAYDGSTNDDRGQYLSCEDNASAPDYQFWKWPLVHIGKTWDSSSSSFDAELNFFYQEDSQSTRCHESSPYRTTNLAVYPLEIRYDHNLYRVIFNRMVNRLDYDDDWTTGVARNLYMKSRLDTVQVQHYNGSSWQDIRKYDFKYADEVGQDSIYHGIVWPAGGRTLTLVEIEESGLNGSTLPATEFVYGDHDGDDIDDNMHLTEASNGYGGKVEFVYEEWSEVDGAENRAFKQNASQYPMCSKDRVNDPDPYNSEPDDWKPVNNDIDVYCKRRHMEIESQESMSYIEAYKKLDERFLQPGGSYLVEIKEIAAEGGGTLWLGLSDGVSTQYSDGLANNGTETDMSWKFEINPAATKLEVRIKCTNSVVGDECHVHDEIRVTPLTTRYRVTEKKLYSSASDTDPDVITYTYDEPATNDPGHSAYVKDALDTYGDDGDDTYEDHLFSAPYGEFRGHAVSNSRDENDLVTTTYYHQDDYLKGHAHTTIVSKPTVLDRFETFDTTNRWNTYGNCQKFIDIASDDNALAMINPNSSSGDCGLYRRVAAISDDNIVMLQFKVSATTTNANIFLDRGTWNTTTYQRWGVSIHNGTASVNGFENGVYKSFNNSLLTGVEANKWYVLLLGVDDDDDKFLAYIWERDKPDNHGLHQEAFLENLTWKFQTQVANGTIWLDEYSEGRIHSIDQTRYVANDNMATPNPLPHPDGKPDYMDLDIVWVYTDWSKNMTFNGDASWEGTLSTYKYGSYGNLTNVVESSWNGSTFVDYRMHRTGFYPRNDGTNYLVGLPGFQNSYKCPSGSNGSCYDILQALFGGYPWGFEHATSSVRYRYDNNNNFWTPPTSGKLKLQRNLVAATDTNPNLQHFQDTIYDYDTWGNTTSVTAYTGLGDINNIAGQGAQTTTTCYGNFDRVMGTCSDDGYHTYPQGVINNEGHKIQTTYDKDLGVPLSVTDANGVTTSGTYDDFGRLETVCKSLDNCDNDQPSIRLYYADTAQPFYTEASQKTGVDQQGNTTYLKVRKYYNGLGQLLQTQARNVSVNGVTRDILTDIYYDSSGRVRLQSVPYDVAPTNSYNAAAHTDHDVSEWGTTTTYDLFGRVATVTAPDGSITTYTYDDLSTYVTDANGSTTTTYNDVWGQVVKVIPPEDASGAAIHPTVSYTYDRLGRLVRVDKTSTENPDDILTTHIAYDYAGRKVWMDDPDMGEWSYTYDALGNLIYQDDAKDQRVCMYYDDLNRLTGKAYTTEGAACGGLDPEITYFYDDYDGTGYTGPTEYPEGRRTGMQDETGYSIWVYDKRGRVETVTREFNATILEGPYSFSYTYNLADQPETMTYPDGEIVTMGYNANGQPLSLSTDLDGTLYASDAEYDAAGRLTTMTSGDGLSNVYDYYAWDDQLANVGQGGRLHTLTVGSNLLDLAYTYDAVGNILTIYDQSTDIGEQTSTFGYDALNRLKTAKAEGGVGGTYDYTTTPYTYDELGRLESMPGIGDDYTFDANHPHAVSSAGTENTYIYDANGNMTTRVEDGVTYTQTWNVENKLDSVSWTENSQTYTTTFKYDGDGNRLLKIETLPGVGQITTVYIGGVFEKQIDTSDNPLSALPLDGMPVAGLKQHPHNGLQKAALAAAQLKARQRSVEQLARAPQGDDWAESAQAWITAQEYVISRVAESYQAPNRAQDLRTYFDPDGRLRVVSRQGESNWELYWKLSAFGRGEQLEPLGAPGSSNAAENRFAYVYAKEGIESWYLNNPDGLEQGFTLTERPAGEGELTLAAETNLQVRGDQAVLMTEGQVRLTYTELAVWDAQDTPLKAWLETSEHGLQIRVDDRNAVYPITVDPLLQNPAWEVDGEQGGAQLGFSVSAAGDVNGDGYSDVIVGAPDYDHNGDSDAGAAFVYHGSASGLSSTSDWSFYGDQAGAHLGFAVETAGDVNGDGYADVIIGAPDYDFDRDVTGSGRAYIFAGSASGLGSSPIWTAEGDEAGARFGFAVSTSGDVNGDDYADVAVGAPLDATGDDMDFDTNSTEGRVFVYHGNAQGLENAPNWVAAGEQDMARFGHALAAAGDVNGDGWADLVVGAPLYGSESFFTQGDDWVAEIDSGKIYVYFGSNNGGLSADADWTATGDQANAQLGYAVGTAGDVNGDGYADLIAGAPYYDNGQTDEGQVFVYYTISNATDDVVSWTASGTQANAHFGYAVGTAGDTNGDGYGDVIIGADGYDTGVTNAGSSQVYAGSANGLGSVAVWRAYGNQQDAAFGAAVGVAGDVNGDGYNDIIVGSPGSTNGGTSVYYGGAEPLSETAGWVQNANQANAQYGYIVNAAGDVNGDGYADVVVGAPRFDNSQTDEGWVFVYYGSENGLDLSASWMAESNQAEAQFGYSAGAAGDVNGDGYDDLIVGAPYFDQNLQMNTGQIFIYYGSADGLSAAANWTAAGDQSDAHFGAVATTAGDVNGDGYGDVIVGAPDFNFLGQSNNGRVFIYYGSEDGLNTTANWTMMGDQTEGHFGAAAANAGDVNADGFSDLIVGAYAYDQNNLTDAGAAFVYHGSTNGLCDTPNWQASGFHKAEAHLGYSVSTAGDVNGDGYSDVVIGAPKYTSEGLPEDPPQENGTIFVYYGGPDGLDPTNFLDKIGDQDYSNFGISVSTAGDVNGDGYSDVIVGANLYDGGQTDEGRASVYYGSASGLGGVEWTAESDQADARFGNAVSGVGDVNGDGYADVAVGAKMYEDGLAADVGRVTLYYGGGQERFSMAPRQRQDNDTIPLALLGLTHHDTARNIYLEMTASTPFGCGRVRLELELKPVGIIFDGTELISDTIWTDTCTTGTALHAEVSGLADYTAYHWRARMVYHPADFPALPHGPWVAIPWNGWNETDFRTNDITSPTSTHTLAEPDGEDGWYITAPEITLEAVDSGIGVDFIEYSLDGCVDGGEGGKEEPTWLTYNGPFTVNEDGSHFLCHRAYDRAENFETPPITATFKVDITPPQTSVSLAGYGENGWYRNNPVTVTLAITDGASGVQEVQYRVDDGSWETHAGATDAAFPVSGEGHHDVTFKAQDTAGNWEMEQTVSFEIDASVPLILNPTPAQYARVNDPTPLISVTLDNAGSGITWAITQTVMYLDGQQVAAENTVKGNDQAIFAYTPAEDLAEGTHTVFVRATDLAGNHAEAVWQFTVDSKTRVRVAAPLENALTNQDTITLTVDTEPGQWVTVTISSALGTGVYTTTNGWLAAPGWPLAAGQNAITVAAEDAIGNTASTSVNITNDPTQHAALVYADAAAFNPAPDSYSVDTAQPERQLAFTARAYPQSVDWRVNGWTLSIYQDSLPRWVLRTISSEEGELAPDGASWLIHWNGRGDDGQVVPEGDYLYELEVTLKDQGTGETAAATSAAGAVNVDYTAPGKPTLMSTAQDANSAVVWFRHAAAVWGHTNPEDEAEQVTIYYARQGVTATAQLAAEVSLGGDWLVNLSLVEGEVVTVTAAAVDAAGNESALSDPLKVGLSGGEIFTAPVEIAPMSIGRGTTAVFTATTWYGGGAPAAWVKAIVPAGTSPIGLSSAGVSGQEETWTGTWTTPQNGSYQGAAVILFQTEDEANPPGQDEAIAAPYLDLKPPWIAIHSPAMGSFQGTEVVTVTGAAEPFSLIWVTAEAGDEPYSGETTSDASGFWQVGLMISTGGEYTLQAQATDRAGNVGPVAETQVVVDFEGPVVQEASADPEFLNPTHPDIRGTTLNAFIVDELTGVVWAEATVHDLPEPVEDERYTPSDPTHFSLWVDVNDDATEGRKDVDIRAADWLGNESFIENRHSFIVDSTAPQVITVTLAISTSSEHLYLADPQKLYHGPQSSGSLMVNTAADDSKPLLPDDEVAGIDFVTFPDIFTTNDGGNEQQAGETTVAASREYAVMGSNGDVYHVTSATDRAGNVSGQSRDAFTVVWDDDAPNLSGLSLTHNAAHVYQPDDTALYYGPLSSGDLTVMITSHDDDSGDQSGMDFVRFPDLFDSGTHDNYGSASSFGRTYDINGASSDSGTFPLTAYDRVYNSSEMDFTVLKDETAPDLTALTLIESSATLHISGTMLYYGPNSSDSFQVSVNATDPMIGTYTGSGVQHVTFPAVFDHGTWNDASDPYQRSYTVSSPVSGDAGDHTLTATDNVDNNANPAGFTLAWDAAVPTLSGQTLTLSADATHAVLDGDILYIGPSASGSFVVSTSATDGESGMSHVRFPALFGDSAANDTSAPYQKTYTINDTQASVTPHLTGYDRVGNGANGPAFQVYQDHQAPDVTAAAAAPVGWEIAVTWSGDDGAGAGVAHYDVEYKVNDGGWQPWLMETTDTGAVFTGAPGQTYRFRVTATDRVGNAGQASAGPVTIELETVKYYLFGGQRVAMRRTSNAAPGNVYYLHGDHLGSVSLTTDEAGDIVSQARNLPFGEVRWSTGNPGGLTDFGFTGQRAEKSFGLMDYNARYYSPYLGRFISADTIVPEATQGTQAWDRYAYVNNSPVNYTDPDGHMLCSPHRPCEPTTPTQPTGKPHYEITSPVFLKPPKGVVSGQVNVEQGWTDHSGGGQELPIVAGIGILSYEWEKLANSNWREMAASTELGRQVHGGPDAYGVIYFGDSRGPGGRVISDVAIANFSNSPITLDLIQATGYRTYDDVPLIRGNVFPNPNDPTCYLPILPGETSNKIPIIPIEYYPGAYVKLQIYLENQRNEVGVIEHIVE